MPRAVLGRSCDRGETALRWIAGGAIVLLLSSGAGCRQPPPPAAQTPTSSAQSVPATPSSETPARPPELDPSRGEPGGGAALGSEFDRVAGALGLGRGGRTIPAGLVAGGDCPAAGPDADDEISAQAAALVPLKVGLTMTNLWMPTAEEEYECLNQVTAVDRQGIVFSIGCTSPRTPDTVRRRTCRSDLRSARMLHTQVGGITVIDASGETVPETVVGATEWSLSGIEFAELKRTGATRHHYVQLGSLERLAFEATAVLRREGTGTARVAVNDRTIDLPVIRASGDASLWMAGRSAKGRVTAVILDDDRFPLLIDYAHWVESSERPHFRLQFPKISFPNSGSDENGQQRGSEMERQLTENKRVDVYGIYFDFASDRIRTESEPILREIADVLGRNRDWTLSIDGHTDNIGGDTYNLDLSRRRSEAVRKALVDRLGISGERLTTAGHGAAAPKDTNDTPEGRARNRRVELVRQ